MITTEVKINGIMIAHLYAVNKGQHMGTDHNIYKFEYIRFGSGFAQTGNILHKQEDGAEELIIKILKLVQSSKKENGDETLSPV